MTKNNDIIWSWVQSKGRLYKVVSNREKGTITVYNEKNEKVMERINLSKKQVEIVENNLLSSVAKKITFKESDKQNDFFDPMIA